MPRNGTTGVATQPINTRAVDGETIMADKWNSVTDDIYSIVSAPTPITQGGTGATTASAARTALDVYAKSETYTRGEVDGFRTTDQNAAKDASNLTTGTVADARLPARLQSGSSLSIANQAEAEAGAENTKAMTSLRTKQHIDARLGEYTSSEISIVSGGAFSVTHSLGVIPKVQAYLLCKVAEGGYSVGQYVPIKPDYSYIGAHGGIGLAISATGCQGRFGNYALPFDIVDLATGGQFYVTNANWRLILRFSK